MVLAHQWQGDRHRIGVWQISLGDPVWVTWLLYRAEPLGEPAPITLLSPDGCWPHVINDAAMEAVLVHREGDAVNATRIESLFETGLTYLAGAAPVPQFTF